MRVFILASILLFSVDASAQFNWDSKHWNEGSLGFGCSVDGQMTIPVLTMTQLLAEKRIQEIRKTLHSKVPAEQYLATFLVEQLSNKGELQITDDEQQRILTIKSSTEMVPFCSGCTVWTEIPLNELFQNKNHEIVSVSAGYWFKNFYKTYYNKKKRNAHH